MYYVGYYLGVFLVVLGITYLIKKKKISLMEDEQKKKYKTRIIIYSLIIALVIVLYLIGTSDLWF